MTDTWAEEIEQDEPIGLWPADHDQPSDAEGVPEDDYDPPPHQVARYLKRGENRVIATRQHWVQLIPPAMILAGGLGLAIALNVVFYWHPAVVHNEWAVIMLGAGGYFAWRWQEWRAGWFVVTPSRLMTISGVISRKVNMLPLSKLRDLEFSQSVPGRALGYGDFHCDSIATDHALSTVSCLPDAVDLYTRVCELMMPADGKRGPR